MTKKTNLLGVKGTFLNLAKGVYEEPTVHIVLNDDRLKTVLPRPGPGRSVCSYCLQWALHCEVLDRTTQQINQHIKVIRIGKEKSLTVSIHRWQDLIYRKIIRKIFSEHWTIYPWLLSYLSTWVHSSSLLPLLFSSGFKISPLKLKSTTLCSRNETWLLHTLLFDVLRELIPFQKKSSTYMKGKLSPFLWQWTSTSLHHELWYVSERRTHYHPKLSKF